MSLSIFTPFRFIIFFLDLSVLSVTHFVISFHYISIFPYFFFPFSVTPILSSFFFPISYSSSPHPTVWLSSDFHRETDVHRLRGVIRRHAHTHHVEKGRPGDCAILGHHHRHKGVHEFPPDFQGVAQTQRELHLHCQQRRCHCQHREAAHSHRWGREEEGVEINRGKLSLESVQRGSGGVILENTAWFPVI